MRRINLCVGDSLAWRSPGATAYRGDLQDWPDFLARLYQREAIDAVLMHSEQRPYHREAAELARARNIDVYVTELGYLRPDWMTLERNGNSVDSLFPCDPDDVRRLAQDAPAVDRKVVYPREPGLETVDDLSHNLPNVFLWFLYPHYRAHGLHHPFAAYARFLWREGQRGRRDGEARDVRERLAPGHFLFAMQTDTDFQIRTNSQFADMAEALTRVFASFARHAPADATLVVKKHPGDLGPVNWASTLPVLARAEGIAGRVAFADGLTMADWLAGAAGMVTVNSSAGLDALAAGCPTFAMSPAIYDVPGLTADGPLDAFWSAPKAPDADLFDAFVRALAATVQVRGTIYSRAGTRAGAAEMARRIAEGQVGPPAAGPHAEGLAAEPPRHAKARRLGIAR